MPQEVRADEAGIDIEPDMAAMDVLFGDARVWSFDPRRDGVAGPDGWSVPWPTILLPFLRGRTRVLLRPVGATEAVFDEDVTFGDSEQPLSVVDDDGAQLTVDKSGRLQRSFSNTDQATRQELVHAVKQVLHDLREEAGLDAFLSFGCLLGAVREGRLIGHDSDADVSYLSAHTHPYDIARESRRAQRAMESLGYRIVRMSANDFKIWMSPASGRRVGVDVFGAYYFNDLLHIMPNVRGSLPRSALLPTSVVQLEGRDVSAPADPEQLLALLYGDSWRVPDPTFRYKASADVVRHMDGYWQGVLRGRREWSDFYGSPLADRVPTTPSDFAAWVNERVTDDAEFVEVGYGNGRDAVWFAACGHRVTALEFNRSAARRGKKLAAAQRPRLGGRLTFGALNLNRLDAVLLTGARYAFDQRPREIYARFVIDGLPVQSRKDLWLFTSMAQRHGGRTFLEFRTHRSKGLATSFQRSRRRFLRPDKVVAEIEGRGGVIVERVEGVGMARFENEDPDVCRLVVRWDV